MSKETRKDLVLLAITFIASAVGMITCRPLAWPAIRISGLISFPCFAARGDSFVVALLLITIVSGFAGLYLGAEVFPSSKTPVDAFYISFFILAFTDFSPKPGCGQLLVMGQLASGILYLIAAIPLLISRVATFASP